MIISLGTFSELSIFEGQGNLFWACICCDVICLWKWIRSSLNIPNSLTKLRSSCLWCCYLSIYLFFSKTMIYWWIVNGSIILLLEFTKSCEGFCTCRHTQLNIDFFNVFILDLTWICYIYVYYLDNGDGVIFSFFMMSGGAGYSDANGG